MPTEERTRIAEILAGLEQEEQQPGLAQRILAGIPQALSVYLAPQPGVALGEQIKEQIKSETIKKERKNRLKELGATLEIEDILQKAREGRAEAADIRKGEREAKIRGEEFKRADTAQRRQIALTNRFQRSRDTFNATETRLRDIRQNRASKELTELQARLARDNAFYGAVVNESMKAIMSGHMDAKTAVDLAVRNANGENVTEEDIKAMNKAINSQKAEEQRRKLELVGAEARARNQGKTPMEAAQEFAFEFSRRQPMMWILDVDGQEKQVPLNIDPMMKEPVVATGQKFLRNATQIEVQQKALTDFIQMRSFAGNVNVDDQATGASNKAKAEATIRNAINSKTKSFEEIKTEALKEETLSVFKVTQAEMSEILAKVQSEQAVITDPDQKRLQEIEQIQKEEGKLPETLEKEQKELQKKGLEARKSQDAVNTINFLRATLLTKRNELDMSMNDRVANKIRQEIAGIKQRLKDAKAAHPELGDMFKDLGLQ